MNPWLARQLYRGHERWLGRPTFRFARQLEWSQWESPDAVRKLQEAKLRALLTHAGRRVPFYQNRFREAGVDPVSDNPIHALSRLPLLTKQDIRGSIDAMSWHDAPGGLFPHNTGGSTGEPLTFFVDRRRQACDQAARIRTHRWLGVDFGDRELYLWGSPIERRNSDQLKSVRDSLCNQKLLDAFNMSPARMDDYWNEFERFRPRCLFGYPSSIALLVRHAISGQRQPRASNLRAVFVTGEVCHPQDRKRIEEYFGVPVADGYGSRDGGFIAHQCPHGQMHLMAENLYVEIIADGQRQPPGTAGEIVLTHLDAYGMPFIRYRTGDLGKMLTGRCSCGRGLPLMDVVQGRTTDFIHLADGTIKHALSVIYPLREMAGIRQFRVTQRADYSVLIDIVREQPAGSMTGEAVAKSVRRVVGESTPCDVQWVESIQPSASGKHCYVVSHVHNERDGRSAEC